MAARWRFRRSCSATSCAARCGLTNAARAAIFASGICACGRCGPVSAACSRHRPRGRFKLWIGDTDTPDINFDANADTFKTAAQGSGIIDTVENPATGTWVVKTTRPDSEGPWPIYVHTNKLGPISFVRVRQFKQLGRWWFECRLIQAPLAFNDGHERVLPVPPTVRRIRTGSAGSETEPPVNELQALHLPPDFRGTYFLRWNYRVSKLLGIEDGPDEIAAALNAMFEKGQTLRGDEPGAGQRLHRIHRRTRRLSAAAHHRRGEHLRAGRAHLHAAARSRGDGRGAAGRGARSKCRSRSRPRSWTTARTSPIRRCRAASSRSSSSR